MNYVAIDAEVVNFACENMPNRVLVESNAAMCLTRMCLHIMMCVYIVVRFTQMARCREPAALKRTAVHF